MEKQLSFVSLNGSFFLPCLSFQEKFKDINEVIISWSQSEFMLKERANHLSFLNNLLYSISRIWTIYLRIIYTELIYICPWMTGLLFKNKIREKSTCNIMAEDLHHFLFECKNHAIYQAKTVRYLAENKVLPKK